MSSYQIPRALRERLIRENVQVNVAMGMSEAEARQLATEMFEEAMARARRGGGTDFPAGMGDQMLARASRDPSIRSLLDRKAGEGATEEDCRRWWDLSEVERQMLMLQDESSQAGVWEYHMEQGLSEEEAWQIVRKAFPIYGNLDAVSVSQESGDDRPLQPELKFRVMSFIEAGMVNPEEFRRRAERYPSFNAFVRAEMRAGRFPATDSTGSPVATPQMDRSGKTALHRAVLRDDHADIARLLLERGADANAVDSDGVTPLHDAARAGCVAAVRLLLRYGAEVSVRDRHGMTPLQYAVARDYGYVADLLRQGGGAR